MQILLYALSASLVFIGVITNLFMWTPFNAGTILVDALYVVAAAIAVFGPLRKESLKPLRWPIILFLALATWCIALAAFGDGVASQRVLGFRNNIVYPGIWLLLGLSAQQINIGKLRNLIWYSGLVICAFAIVQAMFHHDLPDAVMLLGHGEDRFGFEGQDIFRPTGLVGNTIVFTGFSAIILLIGWMRPERKKFLFQKLLVLIPAVSLYLTYTRTSNVSILLVWGFAWSFFAMKSWWRSLLRFGLVLFTLWVLLGGEAGTTPQAVFGKFFRSLLPAKPTPFVFARMAGQDVSSMGSTKTHMQLIKEGWELIKAHPFVGVGLGSQGYSSKAPANINVMRDGYWMATMLEFGLPGTLIWIAFLAWFAVYLLREANMREGPEVTEDARSVAGSLFLILGYFAIASILNSSYSARTNQCLLWMLAGALLSDRLSARARNVRKGSVTVINGKFIGKPGTGLERFAVETIRALDSQIAPEGWMLLVPSRADVSSLPPLANIRVIRYGLASGILWEQICLPFFAWVHHARILNLCNTAPLLRPGYVCVHDIFYKTRAHDFCGSARGMLSMLWHRLQYAWCAKFATGIMTVSEHSRHEISQCYGVEEGKIAVLGNGWEHMKVIESDRSVFKRVPDVAKGPYFLVLGSHAPNKNLKWVWKSAQDHPDVTYVVAGCALESSRQDQPPSLANLIFTGRVSDGEMKALMEGCQALVFPSLEEGFGIPPLEALSLNRPVIAAKSSCLPEIYGSSVHWFDPMADSGTNDPREILKTDICSPSDVLAANTWEATARKLRIAIG